MAVNQGVDQTLSEINDTSNATQQTVNTTKQLMNTGMTVPSNMGLLVLVFSVAIGMMTLIWLVKLR